MSVLRVSHSKEICWKEAHDQEVETEIEDLESQGHNVTRVVDNHTGFFGFGTYTTDIYYDKEKTT